MNPKCTETSSRKITKGRSTGGRNQREVQNHSNADEVELSMTDKSILNNFQS